MAKNLFQLAWICNCAIVRFILCPIRALDYVATVIEIWIVIIPAVKGLLKDHMPRNLIIFEARRKKDKEESEQIGSESSRESYNSPVIVA